MTAKPYTLHDRMMRFIGIPLVCLLVPAITRFHEVKRLEPVFMLSWTVGFCTTLLVWVGHRHIIIQMRRRFPHYSQTGRRLLVEAVLALLYAVLTTYLLDEGLLELILNREIKLDIGFSTNLLPTVLLYIIYEAIYFFDAWKQNVRQTEAMARENVQSQLDGLKNQLDPHFLFNNMNTLAALIDEDNTDAQQFLEHLADVYRYVLVSRDKNTVPLDEELAFLDAYVYLNKIRFRENLQVKTQLSGSLSGHHVTPLSVQMLVENAIKHNVVSKELPLTITIGQADDGYLVVANNMQPKTTIEQSTRVGLRNIITRYNLLTNRSVDITQANGLFTVRLPLLTAV